MIGRFGRVRERKRVVGYDFSTQGDDGVSRQCKLILPAAKRPPKQIRMSMIDHRDAHLPIMTSEALITAAALSPTFRPSSSTASFVMDDVKVMP